MVKCKDCKKVAHYGKKNGTKKYCKDHKRDGMVCLIAQKPCKVCGCVSSFNYVGLPAKYCSTHAKTDMIDVAHKRCEYPDCNTQPTFRFKGSKVSHCAKHKLPGMIDNGKKCAYENCDKHPTFNYIGEKKPLYCATHKEDDMVDVYTKLCLFEDCRTKASFNYEGMLEGKYCRKHKKKDMIYVLKKKTCKSCDTVANFNYPGKKTGVYCCKHKLEDMVDIKNIKCKECDTRANFNFKGEKTPISCSKHKIKGMIDIRNKICEYDDCTTKPTYGLPGTTIRKRCVRHKTDEMIDICHKRCEHKECSVRLQPWHYGYPGQPIKYCAKHKKIGMMKYSKTRCSFKDDDDVKCKETAIYGIKKPLHCEAHKEDKESNLIEKKCISCGLPNIVDIAGTCESCNTGTIEKHRLYKQKKLVDYLIKHDHIPKQVDQVIDNSECGKERPDILYDMGSHFIIIECDEDQHIGRPCECEQTRMINIFNSLGLPVWFIRFNPDKYRKLTGKKRVNGDGINKRYDVLGKLLEKCKVENPADDDVCIYVIYLYFDDWNGTPNKNVLLEYE